MEKPEILNHFKKKIKKFQLDMKKLSKRFFKNVCNSNFVSLKK